MYGASIRSCRPCPKREQCQWQGNNTSKPRQVSVLLHPLTVSPASLLWRDGSRREHRRACLQLVRHQQVEIQIEAKSAPRADTPKPLSRAERAHVRLTWTQRLARNARLEMAGRVTIRLFGVPEDFAASLDLARA